MQKDRWCVVNIPITASAWADVAVPLQMASGCNIIKIRPSVDVIYGDDSSPSLQDGLRAGVEKEIGNAGVTGKPPRCTRFDPGEVVCRVKAASQDGVLVADFTR